MKVVVTGASGFVGSHLTDRLLHNGHRVVGMDLTSGPNLRDAGANSSFRFVAGDIRDPSYLRAEIDREVDLIFHMAAVVGVRRYLSDPLDVIDINVFGTRNVLEAAMGLGTKVILASTSEIYGKNPKTPWAEDDDRVLGGTTVDRWSYSTSKAASEHLALAIHNQHGLPLTIVRYFNAYGPRQAPIYVVSRAIHRALNGLKPLLYDGGQQTRCFTYIDDVIDGTLAAATGPEGNGQVFNIGNSTETTVEGAIELVLELCGADTGSEAFSTAQSFGNAYQDIVRRVPDTSKALRMLGWEASTDLAEGVARTIGWARAQPEWLAIDDTTDASAPTIAESAGPRP